MKTLQDLYRTDQALCANFLDSLNLQVSVKIKGISLQVYYNEETNNYEYHTHTDDLAIGPKISRLTKLFSKDITDAIAFLDTKKDAIDKYRFLNMVIYDKELYLISAMEKNSTDIIDDYVHIIDIANTLEIKSPLIIFRGRLTKEMQTQITNHIAFPTPIDSTEFKNKFKAIFCVESNGIFPQGSWDDSLEYIDGLIFTLNFGDKVAKYKIDDPQYAQLRKQKRAAAELEKSNHRADREHLVECMNAWLLSKAERLDDSHMLSLQKNCARMVKSYKILMKIITAAAKLPVRKNRNFMLQIDLLTDDLQALIRKHGTPMRTYIEQFLITYYKKRENTEYSKEVQDDINKIIDII